MFHLEVKGLHPSDSCFFLWPNQRARVCPRRFHDPPRSLKMSLSLKEKGILANSIGNKKTGSRRLDRWEDTRQWHWPNPVEYISVVALPTAFYSTILLQLGGRGKRVELWFYGMAVYGETVHPLATLATFVLMDCYLEHHANHMLFWIRYFLPLIRLVGRHNKNTMSFLSKIWFAIEIQLWRKLTEDNEWFVRFFLWSPWYIFNSMSFFNLSWIVVSMGSTPDMCLIKA